MAETLEEIDKYKDSLPDARTKNLGFYTEMLSQGRVLTRSQEMELFRRVKAGTKYEVVKLNRGRPVSCATYRTDDAEEARQELMKNNLKLVFNRVRKMVSPEYFDDIFQEGFFVLERAIDNFRVESGNKFSTYLVECLKTNLKKKIAGYLGDRAMYVPVKSHTGYLKLEEEAARHGVGVGTIFEESGLSKKIQRTLLAANRGRQSSSYYDAAQKNHHNGKDVPFIDLFEGNCLGEKVQQLPQEEADKNEKLEKVFRVMGEVLTPRERQVLLGYYCYDKTLKKLGAETKLTKEGIRQIKLKAIKKVRATFGGIRRDFEKGKIKMLLGL